MNIRYYGNRVKNLFLRTPKPEGGTIHSSGYLDVETYEGKVVSVWFRCRTLPFEQHEIGYARYSEMRGHRPPIRITGLNFIQEHDGALDG